MIQAMYSGVSGLRAFKTQLDVIGNNIANLNTIGFKSSRVAFQDTMSQTMNAGSGPSGGGGGMNPTQVGLGVTVGSIDMDTTQGSLQSTGRASDVAIEGGGYLMLGNGSKLAYTRNGAFSLDADFNLVSASSGMKVLGWTPDALTGAMDTSQVPDATAGIKVPIGNLCNARQTSLVKFGKNLNLDSPVAASVSPNAIIYDSLGHKHEIQVTFEKTANASEWSYDVFCPDVDDGDPTADPPVAPAAVASGTITFNENGYSEIDLVDVSLDFAQPNGSTIPLDFQLSFGNITQFASGTAALSDVAASYQDGLGVGTLQGFDIERNGIVMGTFDNGSKQVLGQLALASFSNPAGLIKAGSNMLIEGPNSGVPQVAPPGSGSRGSLAAGFLETSNVDLANEFANMIMAQRGFQANARTITTSDEVVQELVQLKR